jgi:hypothetical protein
MRCMRRRRLTLYGSLMPSRASSCRAGDGPDAGRRSAFSFRRAVFHVQSSLFIIRQWWGEDRAGIDAREDHTHPSPERTLSADTNQSQLDTFRTWNPSSTPVVLVRETGETRESSAQPGRALEGIPYLIPHEGIQHHSPLDAVHAHQAQLSLLKVTIRSRAAVQVRLDGQHHTLLVSHIRNRQRLRPVLPALFLVLSDLTTRLSLGPVAPPAWDVRIRLVVGGLGSGGRGRGRGALQGLERRQRGGDRRSGI